MSKTVTASIAKVAKVAKVHSFHFCYLQIYSFYEHGIGSIQRKTQVFSLSFYFAYHQHIFEHIFHFLNFG